MRSETIKRLMKLLNEFLWHISGIFSMKLLTPQWIQHELSLEASLITVRKKHSAATFYKYFHQLFKQAEMAKVHFVQKSLHVLFDNSLLCHFGSFRFTQTGRWRPAQHKAPNNFGLNKILTSRVLVSCCRFPTKE